jgi:hypothetical protein
LIAFSVVCRRKSSVHPSVKRRIGLDPMNVAASRDDLAGQGSHVLDRARTGAGQSEIEGVDPQRFHQMKDFDLFGNRRIAHRRRLQSVTQGLIVEQDRPRRLHPWGMVLVPVVDEVGGVHGKQLLAIILKLQACCPPRRQLNDRHVKLSGAKPHSSARVNRFKLKAKG